MATDAAELLTQCLGWHEYVEQIILAVPWFVAAGIFGIGQVYGSALIQMFSFYLFLTHYTMVAINGSLNVIFPDPMCPVYQMLGGLSHVTHYVVSITVFVLLFHGYKKRYPGFSLGMWLFLGLMLPPFILMWLGVRSPTSVGVTLLISTLLTFGFFAFAIGLNPEPQYLIRTGLVETLHYNNFDLLLTPDQKRELELDRLVTERITSQCAEFFKHKDAWKNGLLSGPPSAYFGVRDTRPAVSTIQRVFGT